jgi:hypothetical protein
MGRANPNQLGKTGDVPTETPSALASGQSVMDREQQIGRVDDLLRVNAAALGDDWTRRLLAAGIVDALAAPLEVSDGS